MQPAEIWMREIGKTSDTARAGIGDTTWPSVGGGAVCDAPVGGRPEERTLAICYFKHVT